MKKYISKSNSKKYCNCVIEFKPGVMFPVNDIYKIICSKCGKKLKIFKGLNNNVKIKLLKENL